MIYLQDISKYLTVTALTKYLKYLIDNDEHLQNVYLRGEISNFKLHSRGHLYFSLKDENSKINAIMFAGHASKLKFKIEDGMKVLVKGKVSVYEPSGNYQIYVTDMIEDGIGNLYVAFEQLKKQLTKEGLFDQKHKKPIPKIPNRIGIITAPTGAAIKDILSTIKRRYPICETILFPSLVQGPEAHLNLIKQLQKAEEYDLDVLIIGRGGGSIEDLWPFNEELLARTIFDFSIPIISAVGHEVDYTICDFVADVRAATPTGAAEIAVPNLVDLLNLIENYKIRLNKSMLNQIDNYQIWLNKLRNSYVLKNPMAIYQVKEQMLDHLIENLITNMKNLMERKKNKYNQIASSYVLKKPQIIYEQKQNNLNKLIEKLEVLNPMSTLKRGYAIIKKNNKAIFNIKLFKPNDEIDIILNEGLLKVNILRVEGKTNDKGRKI